MAIYSLHHTPIGRATQARPHTAAAHVGYITRRHAMSRYDSARFPENPRAAADHLTRMENGDRLNARVADKVRLALPRELDAEQRAQLVRSYAEDVTQGRASWLAAFHDLGTDAHNPHCHLLIRDRDPDTGKRVIGMSENGSTERLRALWETHANQALERAGHAERVDRRTLAEQGIDRAPTIHEGPRAQQMHRRGARATSRVREARNRPGTRQRSRLVDYPAIDGGVSRPAYNAGLEADYWAAIDAATNTHAAPASVEPVGPLPLAKVEGVIGAPGPEIEAPLGLVFGQPGREPTAQSIAFGELHNETPDMLTERPQDGGNTGVNELSQFHFEGHNPSIGPDGRAVKGQVMTIDDDVARLNRQALVQARHDHDTNRASFDNIMGRSYRDPKAAEQGMMDYRLKHGTPALMKRLEDKPQSFGHRPGSVLHKEGWKLGADAKRRDADIARKGLPSVTSNYFGALGKMQSAQTAYDNGPKVLEQEQRTPASRPAAAKQAPRVSGTMPEPKTSQQQDAQRGQPALANAAEHSGEKASMAPGPAANINTVKHQQQAPGAAPDKAAQKAAHMEQMKAQREREREQEKERGFGR